MSMQFQTIWWGGYIQLLCGDYAFLCLISRSGSYIWPLLLIFQVLLIFCHHIYCMCSLITYLKENIIRSYYKNLNFIYIVIMISFPTYINKWCITKNGTIYHNYIKFSNAKCYDPMVQKYFGRFDILYVDLVSCRFHITKYVF